MRAPDHYRVFLSRLVADEQAMLIILEDLFQLYQSPDEGGFEVDASFEIYAQQQLVERAVQLESLLNFWAKELIGAPSASRLPLRANPPEAAGRRSLARFGTQTHRQTCLRAEETSLTGPPLTQKWNWQPNHT